MYIIYNIIYLYKVRRDSEFPKCLSAANRCPFSGRFSYDDLWSISIQWSWRVNSQFHLSTGMLLDHKKKYYTLLHKLKRPSIIFFITFHNTLYPVLTRFFRWMVHAWDFQARCRLALQEAETGWAEKRFASERQPRNTVELSSIFWSNNSEHIWTYLNHFKPSKSIRSVIRSDLGLWQTRAKHDSDY